jgi:hypothetical protein
MICTISTDRSINGAPRPVQDKSRLHIGLDSSISSCDFSHDRDDYADAVWRSGKNKLEVIITDYGSISGHTTVRDDTPVHSNEPE